MDPEAALTAAADVPSLRLLLPARRDALEPARQAVLGFIGGHRLGERTAYRVELVLEETLMNALLHGHDDGAEHEVELTVQVQPEQILLQFSDDGVAFDPRLARDPARPTSIGEAVPGGLGLMLVRRSAASIDYCRRDDRNHLTIAIARG